MSDARYTSPITPVDPRPVQDVSGVLGARVFAWIGDIIVVAMLTFLLAISISVLGVLTLGLGWLLFPALAATVFVYAAITIGGRKQATWGMRMAGLRVETASGGKPDALAAAVHALLFYVAAGTIGLWLLTIAFGLMRSDRRLGHDLLTGLVVVRA
jgi:uncharacterized RDD family membrane protein YckC